MAGIIFIVISILIFVVLAVVSKKNRIENKSLQNNQTNKTEIIKNTTEISNDSVNNELLTTQEGADSEDEDAKVETSIYSPKSYKDDEEYRRMVSLAKSVYFTLVTITLVFIGVLYFFLLK